MAARKLSRKLAAILSSDVVGYSRLMGEDDEATVAAIVATRKLMGRHVRRYAGRVVDSPGDALLAEFKSALDAVRCAIAVQKDMSLGNANVPVGRQMRVRIGIDVGDVIERDSALYGHGVNIASRLQALAPPDGICVSGSVHDQVENRLDVTMTFDGERKVKNIEKPIRVFQISVADAAPVEGRAGEPSVAGPQSSRTNVPPTIEILFGRDRDREDLIAEMSRHRLVTLLGAGGIGKTRLAQAVAAQLGGTRRDGVWWVDLSSITTESDVVPYIVRAAGLVIGEGDPTAALAQALAERQLLLVLDNCEHLVSTVAVVVHAALRSDCNLSVLATSQAPLSIGEEFLYRLDPLALPRKDATLDEARRSAAIQLLEARVQSLDRGFTLSDATIAPAIDICLRLDGVALAVEMAAARIPVLGLPTVSAKLTDRLRLLKADDRSAPARQQTLRATLDWTHALLSPRDRAVLRRLSIFAGSFRLDAAQQVGCGAEIDEWDCLDALASLVAKSLVQLDPAEPPRYRLLETTKLYALERLAEAGESDSAEEAHGRAMALLAEESISEYWKLTDKEFAKRYSPDAADLDLAFDSACRHRNVSVAAVTGPAISNLQDHRIAQAVDQHLKQAAHQLLPMADPLAQARLLHWFANFSTSQFAGLSRRDAAIQALAASCRVEDPRMIFLALWKCAVESARVGDWLEADCYADQARRTQRPEWLPRMRAVGLMHELTLNIYRGDAAGIRPLAQSCLELFEEAGAVRDAAWQRHNIADAALMAGELDEAIRLENAVIAEMRALNDDRRLCFPLANLCAAYLMKGDTAASLVVARDALTHLVRMTMQAGMFDHLALIAARRHLWIESGQLLGASDAWYRTDGRIRQPNEARLAEMVVSELAESIGAIALDRLRTAGEELQPEGVLALAYRSLEGGADAPLPRTYA